MDWDADDVRAEEETSPGYAHVASRSDAHVACAEQDDTAKLPVPGGSPQSFKPPDEQTSKSGKDTAGVEKKPTTSPAGASSPVIKAVVPPPPPPPSSAAASSGSAPPPPPPPSAAASSGCAPPPPPPPSAAAASGTSPVDASPHAQSAFQGHAQAALEIPEVPRIAREHVFLDFARNYNWIQLGQMLEEDGTLINVTANGLRWSALHQASRAGEVKVVEYLLSRRADHTMRNPQGKLPLDLADHKAIKRLLAMAEAGSLSFEGGMPARPNAVGGILAPEEGGNAAHYYYPPGYSIGQTYAGLRRARWMEGEE